MKRCTYRMFTPDSRWTRVFMIVFLIALMTGLDAYSKLPLVRVRFANPVYDNTTQGYRVDVEFQTDEPGLVVFGMNVRFMYDEAALRFLSFKGFRGSYGVIATPKVLKGTDASGALFGFKGAMEFVNGAIQLKSVVNPIRLTTNGWTKLFSADFKVKDPEIFSDAKCCTSLIWDLKSDPEEGGYLHGDDGVVITSLDPDPNMDSAPVKEVAANFSVTAQPGDITSVKDLTDEFGMALWPNPTPGPVNIELNWKGIRELELKVFDPAGKEILRKDYKAGDLITFDLSKYVTGVYQVEINVDGEKFIHKVVLDRRKH